MALNLKGLNYKEMVVLELLLKNKNIGPVSVERLAFLQGYSFIGQSVPEILDALVKKELVYISEVEVNKLTGAEIKRYSAKPEPPDYLAALIEANSVYSDAVLAEAAIKFVNRIDDKQILQTMRDILEEKFGDS